jgi:hypothetical protein
MNAERRGDRRPFWDFTLLVVTATLCVTGCAHPLDVKVIDAATRSPIAGAQVERMDMQRPYFIAGAIVPMEEQVTDSDGIAHLKDRRGMVLFINARGFEPGKASIERKAPSMTAELKQSPTTTRTTIP